MYVITPTSVIWVSWGSLMYQRLLMSIERKLKTSINLSCLVIDRSINILSGRERERDNREQVYL